jgi:hypothetical protein
LANRLALAPVLVLMLVSSIENGRKPHAAATQASR